MKTLSDQLLMLKTPLQQLQVGC